MPRFRKKPVVIEAVLFDGANHAEVSAFTEGNFCAVDPEDRGDDPEVTANVFDILHSTWVGVKDGQWVIRGVRGEFYPCDPDVLAETYEPCED